MSTSIFHDSDHAGVREWVTMDNHYGNPQSRFRFVTARGVLGKWKSWDYHLWGCLAWWFTPRRATRKAFQWLAEQRELSAKAADCVTHGQQAVNSVQAEIEVERYLREVV